MCWGVSFCFKNSELKCLLKNVSDMSYLNNTLYINEPFSPESACTEFYTYSSLKDLSIKSESQYNISRCRTIGILQSNNGKFYLLELDSDARKTSPQIRLSFIYLKSTLPSTVVPFPVQVFGFLQWKNGPVIYVNLLQVLNIRMALRLREAMNSIAYNHQAIHDTNYEENNDHLEISL